MKNKIFKIAIGSLLFIGLLALLKIYFDTPYSAIIFLVALSASAGLIRTVAYGFINPGAWLYRIRFSVLGIFYGIFIGIMLFGMEAIKDNTFIVDDLLKYLLIGAVIGCIFNSSLIFGKSKKLTRRKGLFLLKKQLVKDFAQLIKTNGERSNGKLLLTNEQLIFIENSHEKKVFEKQVREIDAAITKTKFLGIPNGFKIENDETQILVPFPYYWLERMDKRKRIKTAS